MLFLSFLIAGLIANEFCRSCSVAWRRSISQKYSCRYSRLVPSAFPPLSGIEIPGPSRPRFFWDVIPEIYTTQSHFEYFLLLLPVSNNYFFKDYPIDSVCCLNMDFTTQCWLRRQTFGYWMPASTRAVGCAPNARRKGWNRGRNFQGLDRFETVQNSILNLNSSVEFNESQGFYWKCMWPTGDSSVLCRWRPMISSKPSMESLG